MSYKSTLLISMVCGVLFAVPVKASDVPSGGSTPTADVNAVQHSEAGEGRQDYQLAHLSTSRVRYPPDRYNEGDIPVRRILRELRDRGLTRITDFRRRGNNIIFRAENENGTVYKVIVNARSGKIRNMRRIRSYAYRPSAPYNGYGYNNWYTFGYYSSYRPRYRNYRRNNYNRVKPAHYGNSPRYKSRKYRKKEARRTNRNVRRSGGRRYNNVPRRNNRRLAQSSGTTSQGRTISRGIEFTRTPRQHELWKYGSNK